MPRKSANTAVVLFEDKVELHIASRIRLRRGLMGISQSQVARALGITFQQVQKYERGSNRVSAGRLFRLAEILDVPLTFFFDDMQIEGAPAAKATTSCAPEDSPSLLSRRDLDLLRAWRNAPAHVSEAIAGLLRAVVDGAVISETTATTVVEPSPSLPAPQPRTEMAQSPARRRRGAAWDPADMYSAIKPNRRAKAGAVLPGSPSP
ncbi:helix-turn-helix domain-containing protein [Nitrospirillum amazonense]|uniref:helix-turn-helix domain-containing protein n=1 Tax=Nitrospirillum amazonense TaxID=28077 RepID=UPI00241239AF|nr:helix-turn-helix transcriptional regulator [Nitrospirillum amazonense]MDG3444619.1 helix-turn-helix transcriptional regulator [Nitrospirillum amazonense]